MGKRGVPAEVFCYCEFAPICEKFSRIKQWLPRRLQKIVLLFTFVVISAKIFRLYSRALNPNLVSYRLAIYLEPKSLVGKC